MLPEDGAVTAGLAVPLRRVDAVLAAIKRPTQLVVVTGDAGLGKTTLCQSIARRLDPRMFCSQICTPPQTLEALHAQMLAGFGISREGTAGGDAPGDEALLLAFRASLENLQERAVVIMDNAHDAPPDVVCELFRIASFTAGSSRPFQVVLAGQPALRLLLEAPDVRRAIDSASTASVELAPLGEQEIRHFIERRWWVSQGGADALTAAIKMPRLTRSAVRAIARASRGNPGAVSDICDRALSAAGAGGSFRLTARHARQFASDLGLETAAVASWRAGAGTSWRAPAAAALVVAIAAGSLFAASLRTRARPPARAAQAQDAQDTAGPPASPIVVRDPSPALDAPHDEAVPAETFQTFQSEVLAHAARLSTQPDVLGLLNIENDVKSWDARSNYAQHAAAEKLLDEVDRLTNEARQRQLVYDGNLLRNADH
jgi:general secretion pathway protein A